jgi:hypothetical protein
MEMFGSRVICNPPPKYSDEDWIVFTQDKDKLIIDLERLFFVPDVTGKYDDSPFSSYRLGNINYVITDDHNFYIATCKATRMATELNILNKKDRIVFYKIVRRAGGEKNLSIFK